MVLYQNKHFKKSSSFQVETGKRKLVALWWRGAVFVDKVFQKHPEILPRSYTVFLTLSLLFLCCLSEERSKENANMVETVIIS